MVQHDPGFAFSGVAWLRARSHDLADATYAARGYHPSATAAPMTYDDELVVELLLCASDLARLGAEFGLSAAVEAMGLQYTLAALTAAYETRDVGKLYGAAMSADAYLEAAYRVMARGKAQIKI